VAPKLNAPVVPVVVASPSAAPAPAPEPTTPTAEPAPDSTQPVTGLKLEPAADAAPAPTADTLVFRFWIAFGAALLAALGAWMQWRRGKVPA